MKGQFDELLTDAVRAGHQTAGLVWQFVLVMRLVHREQGTLRWSVVKGALWLHRPQCPRTGRRGGRVWLVLIPLAVGIAAKEFLPKLPAPVDRDLGLLFGSTRPSGVHY